MPIDQKFEDTLPVLRTVLSPVDSLTDALVAERRLIDDLISIMRKQRNAVGDDDLQVVDDSVFATHRVLVTLSEARRRRRNLNALIGQPEDLGIHALDEALGNRMTPDMRVARDELHTSAKTLSREVALNRRVLKEALAAGDQYARTLAGVGATSATETPTYGAGNSTPTQARAQQTTALLDRRI
jgi:hypothetical protein